jgi:hypothetical protein
VVVAVAFTLGLRLLRAPRGRDRTESADYRADAGDSRVEPLPELLR